VTPGGQEPPGREHAWTAYTRVLVGCVLLTLLAVTGLNATVDPFGAYRLVFDRELDPYREEFESRIARGEIARREDCSLVILGTSRAQLSLDPSAPIWGQPACNLAITGAGIEEVEHVFEYALDRGSAREIFWTVDFLSFNIRGGAGHPEYLRSRFNPELDEFSYQSQLLLGSAALRASWHVLRDYWADRKAPFGPLGGPGPGMPGKDDGVRDRFEWSLEHDLRGVWPTVSHFAYAPETVTRLFEGIRRAQTAGIAVTLVILPSHALHYESLSRAGRWEDFERWKRDLVVVQQHMELDRAVPVWDCTSFAGRSAEPVLSNESGPGAMRWHWDSVHTKPSFGNAVVAQVRKPGVPNVFDATGDPPQACASGECDPQVCRELTQDSLDEAFASVRRERARYRAAQASQLEILDAVQQQVGLSARVRPVAAEGGTDRTPPLPLRTGSR